LAAPPAAVPQTAPNSRAAPSFIPTDLGSEPSPDCLSDPGVAVAVGVPLAYASNPVNPGGLAAAADDDWHSDSGGLGQGDLLKPAVGLS